MTVPLHRPDDEPGRIDSLASRLPVASLSRLRDVTRSAFWLLPALSVVIAIALAVGLVALDHAIPVKSAVIVFPGPPEGARSFLSAVVQAMISFTALVFSITIVVLQLSSAQFSPRVLRMFLADRTIQASLGVFVATFVYAMVVLRAVRGMTGSGAFVPRIAVTVAFGFVLASVGLFIRYIAHVANLIRVATIITYIGEETRVVLRERYPEGGGETPERPACPAPAGPVRLPICARRAGVLVSVNDAVLVELARRTDSCVELTVRVGDFVASGAPLATAHCAAPRNDPGVLEAGVLRAVAQDTERTMEQDLAFGFRQLVDIAQRALSPAVNDPTTAVQAIDVLHDLLRSLVSRPLPDGRSYDRDGTLRLVVPQYTIEELLGLAVGQIWRYGADAAQVPARMASMLADLETAALPVHLPAVQAWRALVARESPRPMLER